MSGSSHYRDRYAQFENASLVPSYQLSSTPAVKSAHGTPSQPMKHVPTVPSQGHQFSDANINQAQSLHHSPQGPQFPSAHQMARFQPSNQTTELSWFPTAGTPLPQPPHLEESLYHPEQTPLYVNAKQFHRILKRRIVRHQIGYVANSRGSYRHESRHKHALRRPRGPGGRFLKKGELEREQGKVPKCQRDRAQALETVTNPNTDRMEVERGKPREVGGQNDGTDKLESRQSNPIDRAMTSSFYGAEELEILRKRFEIGTAADA